MIQRVQIIAAANMRAANENLRHRAAARAFGHRLAQGRVAAHVDFLIAHALFLQ